MARPCDCGRVTSEAFGPGQCRRCWLWTYNPKYRKLWGDDPPVKSSKIEPPLPEPKWVLIDE